MNVRKWLGWFGSFRVGFLNRIKLKVTNDAGFRQAVRVVRV